MACVFALQDAKILSTRGMCQSYVTLSRNITSFSREDNSVYIRSKMLPRNIIIALFYFFAFLQNLYTRQQLMMLLYALRVQQLQNQIVLLRNRRRRQRRFQPYWELPRPENSWFEIHFRDRTIPEDYFRRQLRMGRNAFDLLMNVLRPAVLRQNTRFRNCISPERVVAIGLYRLAHGGSYENTGVAMNIGKTTAYEACWDVGNKLYELRREYIKFPITVVETAAEITTFQQYSDLPNIAGAIDGTHIRIKAPKESAVDYFSRYQQHDVVQQDKNLLRSDNCVCTCKCLALTDFFAKQTKLRSSANGPLFLSSTHYCQA